MLPSELLSKSDKLRSISQLLHVLMHMAFLILSCGPIKLPGYREKASSTREILLSLKRRRLKWKNIFYCCY